MTENCSDPLADVSTTMSNSNTSSVSDRISKTDLVQIHRLAHVLKSHFAETESFESTEYDELDINPTAIHKSHDDHKEAVFTLFGELAEFCEDSSAELTVEQHFSSEDVDDTGSAVQTTLTGKQQG